MSFLRKASKMLRSTSIFHKGVKGGGNAILLPNKVLKASVQAFKHTSEIASAEKWAMHKGLKKNTTTFFLFRGKSTF